MSTELETLAAVEVFFAALQQEADIRFRNPEDKFNHMLTTIREYLRRAKLNARQMRMINNQIHQINDRIEHHYEDLKSFVVTGVEATGPTADTRD